MIVFSLSGMLSLACALFLGHPDSNDSEEPHRSINHEVRESDTSNHRLPPSHRPIGRPGRRPECQPTPPAAAEFTPASRYSVTRGAAQRGVGKELDRS